MYEQLKREESTAALSKIIINTSLPYAYVSKDPLYDLMAAVESW